MLEPQYAKHLEAAWGWVDLRNLQEATWELEKVPATLWSDPDLLEIRFTMYVMAEDWKPALAIAETLIETVPDKAGPLIFRSVALHELKRTQEAYDRLLPALKMRPPDWVVYYNLTIYLVNLGRIKEAKAMLQSAYKLDNAEQIKREALNDPDLAPLWKQDAEHGDSRN